MEPDDSRDEGYRAVEGPHEDLFGHGTACAAIARSLAPDVDLHSIRVLGSNLKGRGRMFHAGLLWAVDHGFEVVNLSLSSKSEAMYAPLHEVADLAYFARTLLVCAANNQPGPTYPSEYASVCLGRLPPGRRPVDVVSNPHPRSSSALAASTSRWPGLMAAHRRDRQQLRRTARRRDGSADPGQAPRSDAVPGQGRAAGGQRQHQTCAMTAIRQAPRIRAAGRARRSR